MLNKFIENRVVKNILLMLGFGLLSYVLGEIKFVMPGVEGGTTDLREVGFLLGIFYLPHWIYFIGISLITSIATPSDGSYITTVIMHIGSAIFIYYLYHSLIKKIKNDVLSVITWVVGVLLNYYVILMPILVVLYKLLEIIKETSFLDAYLIIIESAKYEVFTTTIVTSLFLVSYKMQRRLRQNNLQLMETKKKAEKSDNLKTEFLMQMSHEIRTPLNSILSFSSLLKMSINNNEKDVEECFNSIETSGKRIIRTVELILNMSQMKTDTYEMKLKYIDLKKNILNDVINEYKPVALQKNIDLSFHCNTENTELFLDEYSTRQIFLHLLDNATKYTDKGFIEVILRENETGLSVSIKDSGIGISDEYLPFLFDPFIQEEQGYTRSYDGCGLGLSLVKKCCDINNALIDVETEKNKGTTITLNFRTKKPSK
ncbi:MAG: HAMP domain-containing histidine kinase [Melioribacteraceae bacterium]|nr:HAMP domain-containing histidine kinase [Melioribacteraceae bacterium]